MPQLVATEILGRPTDRSITLNVIPGSAIDAFVEYGTESGIYSSRTPTSSFAAGSSAEIVIDGLDPDTRYYYAVGTSETNLAGPTVCHFVTSPLTPKNTRIWVLGDSGTANANARAVRDGYYQLAQDEERTADLWLMLGDNAYDRGTDREYQLAVFDMYPHL